MASSPSIYPQVDSLIRTGKLAEARQALSQALEKPTKRWDRQHLAELCRRVGWPERSLRLLFPIVRPSNPRAQKASPAERGEYAAALIRVGATAEARQILQGIDTQDVPQLQLFLAFTHIHEWDYEKAIPCLEAYLQSPGLDPYQLRVGHVNIAAAYTHVGQHDLAEQRLADLRKSTAQEGNWLLHINCLELSIGNQVFAGLHEQAEKRMQEAHRAFAQAGIPNDFRESADALYLEKWRAVIETRRTRNSPESLARLAQVREIALSKRYWETVRDCDFLLALSRADSALLHILYFSTPYPGFRAQIRREASRMKIDLESEFVLSLGKSGPDLNRKSPSKSKAVPRIDLTDGIAPGLGQLKIGQVPHRLLQALGADLYKPRRLAEIFGNVFPDRYFNPVSSPAVIHQGCFRLRAWLESKEIPLEIEENEGHYRLKPSNDRIEIVLRTSETRIDSGILPRDLEQIRRFGAQVHGREFTAQEIADKLQISKRSAQLLAKTALEKKLWIREGAGPSSKYRIAPPSSS